MTTLYFTWESSYLEKTVFILKQGPGGRLNKKDGLTRYGNSHVTVLTAVLSLTWKSPYVDKTVFILKQGPGLLVVSTVAADARTSAGAVRKKIVSAIFTSPVLKGWSRLIYFLIFEFKCLTYRGHYSNLYPLWKWNYPISHIKSMTLMFYGV